MRSYLAILLLSAAAPMLCAADHTTTTTTTSSSWTCDSSRNWIQDVTYDQTVINSRFTAGVTHYNDAIAQCKSICEDRVSCTGFFYQQHHNTHQICGFYSSPIDGLTKTSHGHLEGAVCTNWNPRTADDAPTVPPATVPRCSFDDVAAVVCECRPDDFFTRHSDYGYAAPAQCAVGMVCSNSGGTDTNSNANNSNAARCVLPEDDNTSEWHSKCQDFFASGSSAAALKSTLMSAPCTATNPTFTVACDIETCDAAQKELLLVAQRAGLASCPLVKDLTHRRSMHCLRDAISGSSSSCGGHAGIRSRLQHVVQRFSVGVPSFLAEEHRSLCLDPCLRDGMDLAYALVRPNATSLPYVPNMFPAEAMIAPSLLHSVERICMVSSAVHSSTEQQMCFPVFADFMHRFSNLTSAGHHNDNNNNNNNNSNNNDNNNNNAPMLDAAYLQDVCSRPDACVQNVLMSSFDNEPDGDFPVEQREALAELMCLRNNDKSCLLELAATDNPLDNSCGRCTFSGHPTFVTSRHECLDLNNVTTRHSTDPNYDPYMGAGYWHADVVSGATMLTGHWDPPPSAAAAGVFAPFDAAPVIMNQFQWQQLDGSNQQCNEQLQTYAKLGCCIESILQSAMVPTEAEAVLIRSLFDSAVPPVHRPEACSMDQFLVPAQIEIPHLKKAECDVFLSDITNDIAATTGLSATRVIDAACSSSSSVGSSSNNTASQHGRTLLAGDDDDDVSSIVTFNLAVPDKVSGDRVSAAIQSPTLKSTEASAAVNGIMISDATGTAYQQVANPYATGTMVYNHSDQPVVTTTSSDCDDNSPSLDFGCIKKWAKEGDNLWVVVSIAVTLTFIVTALCMLRCTRRRGKSSLIGERGHGVAVVKGSAVAGALQMAPVSFVSNASPAVLSGQQGQGATIV